MSQRPGGSDMNLAAEHENVTLSITTGLSTRTKLSEHIEIFHILVFLSSN